MKQKECTVTSSEDFMSYIIIQINLISAYINTIIPPLVVQIGMLLINL